MQVWLPLSLYRFRQPLEMNGIKIVEDQKDAQYIFCSLYDSEEYIKSKTKIISFIFSNQDIDFLMNLFGNRSCSLKFIKFKELDFPFFDFSQNIDSELVTLITLNKENVGYLKDNLIRLFILISEFHRSFYPRTIAELINTIVSNQNSGSEFFPGFNNLIKKKNTKSDFKRLINLFSTTSFHRKQDVELFNSDIILDTLLKNEIFLEKDDYISLNEEKRELFNQIYQFFENSDD